MRVLDAQKIRELVSMPQLIESLRSAFAGRIATPARQFSPIPGGRASGCSFTCRHSLRRAVVR